MDGTGLVTTTMVSRRHHRRSSTSGAVPVTFCTAVPCSLQVSPALVRPTLTHGPPSQLRPSGRGMASFREPGLMTGVFGLPSRRCASPRRARSSHKGVSQRPFPRPVLEGLERTSTVLNPTYVNNNDRRNICPARPKCVSRLALQGHLSSRAEGGRCPPPLRAPQALVSNPSGLLPIQFQESLHICSSPSSAVHLVRGEG